SPFILSLAPHSKKINIICDESPLSNPATFITQLAIDVSSSVLVDHSCNSTSFFGLSHSFWKQFLNEKLSNGSFESVHAGN
ncbi:hypothetical protein PMAYCL1PPCAC_22437, partial [Pristionchus mayeri]